MRHYTVCPRCDRDIEVECEAHYDREFLYSLLDNIDTIDDMAKSDDAAYRRMVQRQQKRRFERADSDGYSVSWKTDKS